MVTYVDGVMRPINAHVDEHDAWHLARLVDEAKAHTASIRAIVSQIVAAGALLIAALALVLHR